jgi:hypothetical protein
MALSFKGAEDSVGDIGRQIGAAGALAWLRDNPRFAEIVQKAKAWFAAAWRRAGRQCAPPGGRTGLPGGF